jgi:hypothetical protein
LATKTSPADVANLIAEAASNYATSAQGAKADSAVQPTALDSYLPKSGGTMTGAIAMGAQKITNLGAPTATTDAATKAYVDGVVVAGGSAPSWATLKATNWIGPHWGDTWEVVSADNTTKVEGVAACLSMSTKSGNAPANSGNGLYCWCRVASVNGIKAFGAWVLYNGYSSESNCYAHCAFACSLCVRYGEDGSCKIANLFAAP